MAITARDIAALPVKKNANVFPVFNAFLTVFSCTYMPLRKVSDQNKRVYAVQMRNQGILLHRTWASLHGRLFKKPQKTLKNSLFDHLTHSIASLLAGHCFRIRIRGQWLRYNGFPTSKKNPPLAKKTSFFGLSPGITKKAPLSLFFPAYTTLRGKMKHLMDILAPHVCFYGQSHLVIFAPCPDIVARNFSKSTSCI